MHKVHIIGSGFSSLATGCYLAKAGYEVTLFEKNNTIGGRAREMHKDGFRFDMGPSWYWMPDVFDKFFQDFGHQTSDFYELIKLSPSYRVHFEDEEYIDVPDSLEEIYKLFEQLELGSSDRLKEFLTVAKTNYEIAMKDLVYKPGLSPLELVTPSTALRLNQFIQTVSSQVRKRFTNPKLIKILEFPVLFLGAKPQNTPGFYNFMNWADFGLGTWYPKGGMVQVIKGMEKLFLSLGGKIETNSPVDKIEYANNRATGLIVNGETITSDIIVSGADYNHTETLLDETKRNYSEHYWDKKTFAPSSLLFYIGFKKKLANVKHHMLFFDTDFEKHASEIYDAPKWPSNPLFYANFTSTTDPSDAPVGHDNGFLLIPLAPGLEDNKELHEKYFDMVISRLEKHTKQSLKNAILFKESYGIQNFINDYNAYKGNAYGMANTLAQTAFLRPKIKNKKLTNLYYTGQLTVPGPGVPPSLISGKIVSDQIIKEHLITRDHETVI